MGITFKIIKINLAVFKCQVMNYERLCGLLMSSLYIRIPLPRPILNWLPVAPCTPWGFMDDFAVAVSPVAML